MKKHVSIVLTLTLVLSVIFGIGVSAASYPSISSSKYIEFKAQNNINVYKDSSCKTRGTSSPSKKYNASIAKNDVCYIYKIATSYIQVNYPSSSGRSTGYIKRSDLFDKTAPEEYISSAKASVAVHKANGSSSIATGDKVWRVDPKAGYSGYRAVIYEAKSGKRAYKMGYITLDDLELIKNGYSSSKTNGKFAWPVGGNGGYDQNNWPKYNTSNKYHGGTDITAPTGTPVYAAYGGKVDSVKSLKDSYGKHIIIKCNVDNKTVYMYYCHLNSFNVEAGDTVATGQQIGTVGSTGNVTGSHLHFEVRNDSKHYGNLNDPTLNPYNYLP